MDQIIVILLIFISLYVYFIPTIIARTREHQSKWAISALNLLLGWTLLGWIASLVWSLTNPAQLVVSNESTSVADEIQKLGKLKEQGLLTDEEFNNKKSEILNKS